MCIPVGTGDEIRICEVGSRADGPMVPIVCSTNHFSLVGFLLCSGVTRAAGDHEEFRARLGSRLGDEMNGHANLLHEFPQSWGTSWLHTKVHIISPNLFRTLTK